MPKNSCIMQIWAESRKSALPICNYSQILYQFLTFTQNLKRSHLWAFLVLKMLVLVLKEIGFTIQSILWRFRKICYTSEFRFRGVFVPIILLTQRNTPNFHESKAVLLSFRTHSILKR